MPHREMEIASYTVRNNIWNFCYMTELLVAISDGILNNDAFKHTTGDANNDTWTQLLLDLKFFDDADE